MNITWVSFLPVYGVLNLTVLFISLSRSKWKEDNQHGTHFMASGSWYEQNFMSLIPESPSEVSLSNLA